MSDILDRGQITGIEEYPVDASVKLNGPPGTGKTTETKSRLALGVDEGLWDMRDVAFATYRRALADEFVKEAEGNLLPEGVVDDPKAYEEANNIGTLHAICLSLNPRGQEDIADDEEKAGFVDEVYNGTVEYYDTGDRFAEKPLGRVLFDARQWFLENLADPEAAVYYSPHGDQLQDRFGSNAVEKLTNFHEAWERWKDGYGLIDFTDMLRDVVENGYAPEVKVIAFDEFHDFTPLMNQIARVWIDAADVAVVNGDPLQAIYTYKGADPEFYHDLDLPEVQLGRSWRVPANIWSYAKATLSPDHKPPDVEPRSEAGRVIEKQSVSFSSDQPASTRGSGPVELFEEFGPDLFFLTRTRAQIPPVAKQLREAGIIYDTQDSATGWGGASKRRGVYNVLAGLSSLAEAPSGGNRRQTSLRDQWGEEAVPPESVELLGEEIAAFADVVDASLLTDTKTDTVAFFTERSEESYTAADLAEWVDEEAWPLLTQGPQSVNTLIDSYDSTEVIRKALARNAPGMIRGPIRTKVQTVHASKGGERDNVVLYSGITSRIRSGMDDVAKRQAEARVWYVGCTRARRNLIVMRGGWSWVNEEQCPTASVLGKHRDPTRGVAGGDD